MRRRRGGIARGVARTAVVAGTAISRRRPRAPRGRTQKWAEQEQAQYEPVYSSRRPPRRRPRPSMTTWPSSSSSPTLHAQGILTDEEFAAKKKQILGI